MVQEEKQLLLKDLCGRLPYGIECKLPDGTSGMITSISIVPHGIFVTVYFNRDNVEDVSLEEVKPYLRPMSSMTDEEKEDFGVFIHIQPKRYNGYTVNCSHYYTVSEIDWLNEHHFDYRGLIEKGLAIEAPEGMYEND